MLLLTRKVQERIRIGDDIEIIICGIKGCQVRVGIIAPKDVQILREELVQLPVVAKQEVSESPKVKVKKSRLKLSIYGIKNKESANVVTCQK